MENHKENNPAPLEELPHMHSSEPTPRAVYQNLKHLPHLGPLEKKQNLKK